jgi:hypothetical protein
LPAVTVPPSVGSVVAVPFTHDWGPLEQAVRLNSFADFTAIFGNSLDQPGYRAVRQAFRGEGVRGRRGAGQVLAYRMGAAAAAKATVTLSNTTPASALKVDAVYEGTRGNDLRVTIQTDPVDATKRDFIVLDGLTEVERIVYDPAVATPLAVLRDAVNAVSDWVRLTVLIDTVPLTPVVSTPLAGGANGATLVALDWTEMTTALEPERFGYFAPFDLTDASILASLKTWAVNLNNKGKRFFVVVGGALNELVATANARSLTFNDPDFINVGVGSVRDDEMLDASGVAIVLSTSQFVPRLAGILAALGEARSLTGARVQGVTLLNGATEAGIELAFDNGTVVLSRDSDPDAPVHIEKGVTTFTLQTDKNRPYRIFRNPKFVRTMHDLQMEITEWVQSNVIGQLPVNSKSRSAVIAEMSSRMRLREEGAAIQPGWTVTVSADPPPSDDDEFIALDYFLAFGRSAEQVLSTIVVR